MVGDLQVKRFEPVLIEVQTLDIAAQAITRHGVLHGQLPWLWQDGDNHWHALVLTGSGQKSKDPDKYVLGPVLFYLLCLAGEESRQWVGSTGFSLHIVYRDEVQNWTYCFDQNRACEYLNQIVADLLDQSMAVWLPFHVVTATGRSIRPHLMAEEDIDDLLPAAFHLEMEEAFEEFLENKEAYLIRLGSPAVPADIFDRARSRFKIFFD